MKKLKKIAEGLGLVLTALVVAALCTWIAADDNDKAEVAQSLEGAVSEENKHEEPWGIDWDSLSQEIVAWVEVPNTSISQPIAKADKQNPNAYLFLDALGQGGYGTPYIDADCAEGSLLIPIYGHNMSNGSVFADFAKYSDEDYARSHSCIPAMAARMSYRSLPWTSWTPALRPCAQASTIQGRSRSGLVKATSFYLNTMGRAKYLPSQPARTRPPIPEPWYMRCWNQSG